MKHLAQNDNELTDILQLPSDGDENQVDITTSNSQESTLSLASCDAFNQNMNIPSAFVYMCVFLHILITPRCLCRNCSPCICR